MVATTTNGDEKDSESVRLWVGSYHDGRFNQRGFYDSERDEVLVKGDGPEGSEWVSVAGWLNWATARACKRMNQRSYEARELLAEGTDALLNAPRCPGVKGDRNHPKVVLPSDEEKREQCGEIDGTDEPLCTSCLKTRVEQHTGDTLWTIYPWETLDDSLREHVEEMGGPDKFEDPSGVLDPLRE